MKILHTTLLTLPAIVISSKCPDIKDDPYLDFSGAGVENDLSKLTFFQSCGPISGTTGQNATDKDDSQFSESVCRIKCNNWKKSRKGNKDVQLFWVKTKHKWKRTKYLQCQCNTNSRGVETCKYKRRGYNYNEERGRTTSGHKLQIACDDPVCQNPKNIDELNSAGVAIIHNPNGETACTNCDINKNRGGTWKCYNKNGDELAENDQIPWKGYCFLTCGYNSKFDIKKKIVCKNPHVEGYRQYDPIWRLYKFLGLKKYKKNMDSELGWNCSADLVEEQVSDEVEEIEDDEDYEDPDEEDDE